MTSMIRMEYRTCQHAPQSVSGVERILTSSVRMCSAIAHSATRREQQSITVARYKSVPVANGR
jgi:hypothetical protein